MAEAISFKFGFPFASQHEICNGEQFIFNFENGYGASVVRHKYSYGGNEGKWELAVLLGKEICYDTKITSDVEGWLSEDDVTKLLREIKKL